jgi:hypothetical protein
MRVSVVSLEGLSFLTLPPPQGEGSDSPPPLRGRLGWGVSKLLNSFDPG